LAGGWDAFLAFGGGVLTVLGALAPFLLVLGTPAVAAFWWFRRRRAVSAISPVAPVEPE
jgi:cytochrome c oxidase assembly factor CtaG